MMNELQRVSDVRAALGEGPSWNAKQKVLYWVDIHSHCIHIYDPDADSTRTIQLDQPVGAVVPYDDDYCIAALRDGIYRVSLADGSKTLIVNPEEDKPNNRFNDGKCDPAGRFWAGTMSLIGESKTGSLYMLDNDGTITKKVSDVSISNGLGWSPDRKTMYYIDTPERVVWAYDYDLETGEISNRRTVVTIPDGEGSPDGMCVDAEGMLWVAHWGGWRVSCFHPETGERLREIRVPAERVTSCCFGGDNLDELYITTASIGMSDEEKEKNPEAGGLFRIKLDIKGQPTDAYVSK